MVVSQAGDHFPHSQVKVFVCQAVFDALAVALSHSLPVYAVEIGIKIRLPNDVPQLLEDL
jgi:hypothetical protein